MTEEEFESKKEELCRELDKLCKETLSRKEARSIAEKNELKLSFKQRIEALEAIVLLQAYFKSLIDTTARQGGHAIVIYIDDTNWPSCPAADEERFFEGSSDLCKVRIAFQDYSVRDYFALHFRNKGYDTNSLLTEFSIEW